MDLFIQYAGPGAVRVRDEDLGEVDLACVSWHEPYRCKSEHDYGDLSCKDKAGPKESKWNHLARLDWLWRRIAEAEVVCFADDDVIPMASWFEAFRLFRRLPLDVAQCALTRDSFYSHPVTLVDPESMWRETSFVEMMAPIMFGRQALEWRPFFSDMGPAAWEVECLWSGGRKRTGILDWTPMRHTRPVRALEHAARFGVDPVEERRAFCERWGLRVPDYAFETNRRHPVESEKGGSLMGDVSKRI